MTAKKIITIVVSILPLCFCGYPKRIGPPVPDRSLDLDVLGKFSCRHCAHQFFQFVITSKAERDYLSCPERACLLQQGRGKSLLGREVSLRAVKGQKTCGFALNPFS